VNEDITLNVDLAPTILGAAGIEVPDFMQGRDMSDLYSKDGADLATPWRTEFFYEHPLIFPTDFIPSSEALVRKDLKYFRWPDFDFTQLFDLRSDPGEIHDVINKTKYKPNVKEMKARYEELKTEAASKYRYYNYPKNMSEYVEETREIDKSNKGADESDKSEEENQSDPSGAERKSDQSNKEDDESDKSDESNKEDDERKSDESNKVEDESDESEEEPQSDPSGEERKSDQSNKEDDESDKSAEDRQSNPSGKERKSNESNKEEDESYKSEEETQSDSKKDAVDESKEADSSKEKDGKSEKTVGFTFSRGEEVTETR
jgi:hypothetical protein